MNEGEGPPQEKLNGMVGRVYRKDEVPWLEADLDGNGDNEFIIVRGVQDEDQRSVMIGQGAALFVMRWPIWQALAILKSSGSGPK